MVSYCDQSQRLHIPCTPVTRMVFAHLDGLTSLHALRKRTRKTVPGATSGAGGNQARIATGVAATGHA